MSLLLDSGHRRNFAESQSYFASDWRSPLKIWKCVFTIAIGAPAELVSCQVDRSKSAVVEPDWLLDLTGSGWSQKATSSAFAAPVMRVAQSCSWWIDWTAWHVKFDGLKAIKSLLGQWLDGLQPGCVLYLYKWTICSIFLCGQNKTQKMLPLGNFRHRYLRSNVFSQNMWECALWLSKRVSSLWFRYAVCHTAVKASIFRKGLQ